MAVPFFATRRKIKQTAIPMNSLNTFDRRLNRMMSFARLGPMLAMLLLLNSCVGFKVAAYNRRNATTLQNQYGHIIDLENQVDAKAVKAALKTGPQQKPGQVALGGVPFWTAPQYNWVRAMATAPISARERRRLKIKCIKKYGMGFVLFKPDPADPKFLRIGEYDDDGFTMKDLHRTFGKNLPPFSSMLKLCLGQN